MSLAAQQAFGYFLMIFGLPVLAGFIGTIFVDIALWKIFKKAGDKGWKALIPVYNIYTVFKLFWSTKWFWVSLGVVIVYCIIMFVGSKSGSYDSSLYMTTMILLRPLFFAVGLAPILIGCALASHISKSFGHKAGFTVGLVLLPYIFLMILAFNKDECKLNVAMNTEATQNSIPNTAPNIGETQSPVPNVMQNTETINDLNQGQTTITSEPNISTQTSDDLAQERAPEQTLMPNVSENQNQATSVPDASIQEQNQE